jgi:CBS domain-containing protein
MDAKRNQAARHVFVRELMTAPAVTVTADTPFKEIVDVLLERNITGVPVVDGEGRLLGVVTQADLLDKQAYGPQPRRPLSLLSDLLANRDPSWRVKAVAQSAGDLMTERVVTARPGDDVRHAAHKMMEARVTRLPVVDGDRVVGVLARHDVLKVFHRPDRALLDDVRSLLGDALTTPEDHAVTASVRDGVVILAGEVARPDDLDPVEAMIWRIPGIVAVENNAVIRERERERQRR